MQGSQLVSSFCIAGGFASDGGLVSFGAPWAAIGAQHETAFDLILSAVVALVLLVPCALVALVVKLTTGPILYWSDGVGRHNRIFRMSKFRSMRAGTRQSLPTCWSTPKSHLTPLGSFLRKSSLDELRQLWSLIRGDMSFVGPRPALFNQEDLIALRTSTEFTHLCQG